MAITLPEKFYDTLKEEIAISEEMLKILSQEQEALTRMDMQALINISARKSYRVAHLQALDKQLQEIASSLTGCPAGTVVKLRTLEPMLDPAEAKEIAEYRLRLGSLREEIFTRNIVNKKFTEETKHFLNDAISTITGAVAERSMYGRSKSLAKPSVNHPSLISREV